MGPRKQTKDSRKICKRGVPGNFYLAQPPRRRGSEVLTLLYAIIFYCFLLISHFSHIQVWSIYVQVWCKHVRSFFSLQKSWANNCWSLCYVTCPYQDAIQNAQFNIYYILYFGLSPLPVRVTTRIITCLVGNPYKPSFPLLLGGGTTQIILNYILSASYQRLWSNLAIPLSGVRCLATGDQNAITCDKWWKLQLQ